MKSDVDDIVEDVDAELESLETTDNGDLFYEAQEASVGGSVDVGPLVEEQISTKDKFLPMQFGVSHIRSTCVQPPMDLRKSPNQHQEFVLSINKLS